MSDERKPTHLDLFSGIGSFSLAFESAGFRTIGFSEIKPYCCAVLKKHWPAVPNFGDIKNITKEVVADSECQRSVSQRSQPQSSRKSKKFNKLREGFDENSNRENFDGNSGRFTIDVLTAGTPCQPASLAGKRRGSQDDRWLWPETIAAVKMFRPNWCLLENVAGFITLNGGVEFDRVLSDLEAISYSTWPVVIPACAVDARHRRDRVWIICHAEHAGFNASKIGGGIETGNGSDPKRKKQASEPSGSDFKSSSLADASQELQHRSRKSRARGRSKHSDSSKSVSNTHNKGLQRGCEAGDIGCKGEKSKQLVAGHNHGESLRPVKSELGGMVDGSALWMDEPDIGRVATNIPQRAKRLKALGNTVVPQLVKVFAKMIMEQIKNKL